MTNFSLIFKLLSNKVLLDIIFQPRFYVPLCLSNSYSFNLLGWAMGMCMLIQMLKQKFETILNALLHGG